MSTLDDAAFWAKVDRSDECWEWQGARAVHGYGFLNRSAIRTSPILAHRYSWYLATGVLPPANIYVCHHCDNPPCVRPDHLFLGTAADNNSDRDAKGRGVPPPIRYGEAHPNVRVSDEIVRAAREDFARGAGDSYEVAERYGVAQATVMAWVHGRARVAAGGPIKPADPNWRAANLPSRSLSAHQRGRPAA